MACRLILRAVQSEVEFVREDGKRGFQVLNEGQQNIDTSTEANQPELNDSTQVQGNSPSAQDIENGDDGNAGQNNQ